MVYLQCGKNLQSTSTIENAYKVRLDAYAIGGIQMNKKEILDCLAAFPYDRDAYWLVTGGAMVLYGIKEQTADIDLGCSKKLADDLERGGFLYSIDTEGKRWFKYGESIEIFEEWIRDSTTLESGFRVVSINGLIAMKQEMGRKKDLKDIELIMNYLNSIEPI